MFSRQAGQLDRLVDLGMAPEVVNVFREMLCNPNQELIHDGIVRFAGSVVSPSGSSVRWAIARHNWDYHPKSSLPPSRGGLMGVVVCQECEDHRGSSPSGDNLTVYLPVPPNHDPNVAKNDIIAFMVASDGTFVAPGYEDSRIGAAALDVDGTNRRKGWAVMDGTLNGKIYGGSAIDLRNRFPRQWNTSSQNKTTGGAATDSVTVGSHAGSAVDSAITVSDHSAGNTGNTTISDASVHTHPLSATTFGSGTGITVTVATADNTGNPISDITHSAHNHTTPALSHTISGSSALSHAAVTVDTVPPFTYLAYMERVNNSRRFLGI
jgi:hypothetical protein